MCDKLKVSKSSALKILGKYIETCDFEVYYVVSGTNGTETKVFIVSSALLEDSFRHFKSIDFHHIYCLKSINTDFDPSNSVQDTGVSGSAIQTCFQKQKMITDFFNPNRILNTKTIVQHKTNEIKSNKKQMSLKNYFKQKGTGYKEGLWHHNLMLEFKELETNMQSEDTIDLMSSQDDDCLVKAVEQHEAEDSEDRKEYEDMSSLDDSFLVHFAESFENKMEVELGDNMLMDG